MPVFTENTYTDVTYKEKYNTIEVAKITETLRDGVVISSIADRKAYSPDIKQQLIDEVENGANLVEFYGW